MSPEAVLAQASSLFLHGERVEMGELAASVGIGRTTLHRWFGGRDRLLGIVIWSLAEPVLDRLRVGTYRHDGPERIVEIVRVLGQQVLSMSPVTSFLQRDPVGALRVLTTGASPVQANMTQFFVEVIRSERDGGSFADWPDLEIEPLAYAILRILEAFVYSDVIAGRGAAPEEAARVVALLLRR